MSKEEKLGAMQVCFMAVLSTTVDGHGHPGPDGPRPTAHGPRPCQPQPQPGCVHPPEGVAVSLPRAYDLAVPCSRCYCY
jgi:hypothetical protein